MRTFGKSPNTIKRKILFSYIVLLIVPLSLLTIFIYFRSAAIIQDKAVKQLNTVTQYTNQQFDQYFKDIDNLSLNILNNAGMQAALNELPVPPKDWTVRNVEEQDRIHDFLDGIYKLKPGISSIVVYGFNEQHYYYHPTRRWDDLVDGMSQPWVKRAMELGGRWALTGKRVENQLFSTLDPNPEEVVTFYRAINDTETFKPLGVLAINVKLDTVRQLAGLQVTSNYMLIQDENGEPIVASPSPQIDQALGDPRSWLKVSTVSPYTHWTSVYLVSRADLFKETKQIRDFIAALTVILLGAALLLANFLSGGIVRPLKRLQRGMKEVERGSLSVRVESGGSNDEVGEITRGFNRMVERVEELVGEIRAQENKRLRTELNAMQARINPHFMYNTLNGIRWVAMMDGNKKVTDLITSFIYLLKFSAQHKDALITVGSELEVLAHYVTLMRMRNDQFDFELEGEDAVKGQLTLPFILQPIVENAIFHGIVPLKRRGRIVLSFRQEDGCNVAVVKDDGVGMEEAKAASLLVQETSDSDSRLSAIGLKNVHERLRLQFGEEAGLSVASKPGAGTVVTIRWPKGQNK